MKRNPVQTYQPKTLSRLLRAALAVFAFCTLGFQLSGCNLIKQAAGPNPQDTRPAFPAPGNGQPGQQQQQPTGPANGGNPKYSGRLSGYWKLAYQLDGKDETFTSSVKLDQNGNRFSGEGTDDHNSKAFALEQGTVQDGRVIFYKRYTNPSNTEQTPVEYEGTVDLSSNPYMSGKFVVALNGQELNGVWEAEKQGGDEGQPAEAPAEQSPGQAEQQQPGYLPAPDHAPDLSGKWNVGFEYRFKEVQSTMWLEQHGDKLQGHGVDLNTKEQFKIEKGWYAYPKVTIIRKYPAIKSGKIAIPEHTMTFKAEVQWVSDKDYTGPYMRGKTDGGGNWEAQLVR